MTTYFRLIRLQDQPIQAATALFAAIVLQLSDWPIMWWALAVTLISCATFIVNELTDRRDTDKYSWNPAHSHVKDKLNLRAVWWLFWTLSLTGFWAAYYVGLLVWGIAMWGIGVLYSLEPVRFKKRGGLDILSQLIVWWVIPFLAPVWGQIPSELSISLVVILSSICWSAFYPYQIADFVADKKAKLKATHVVLGVRQSAFLGFGMGVIGVALFLLFGLHEKYPVLLPMLGLQMFAFGRYIKWSMMNTDKQILLGMQRYVRIVKPLGTLFPFYFFLMWRIMVS
jgi:4-hydroxybenzoate polyprenyltransferase